jgi:deoxyribose-phosphate aldolase
MLMLENATPLPVKAAGGVRTYDEAVEMIKLGVKRIGTSWVKAHEKRTKTPTTFVTK